MEILKNHFGQFYKFNDDNQLHSSYGLKNVKYNFISITTFMETNILVLYLCRDMPF